MNLRTDAKIVQVEMGSWTELSDEKLLPWRIRDLKLKIEGSELEPRINRLYDELKAKGVSFLPPCYLTTE